MAAVKDVQAFVTSFEYSLASQTFIQQPAAAGRNAHLATLSVHHASEAIQTHSIALITMAQQAVSAFVTAQLQELCGIMDQPEVQVVLEAAAAAIRAPFEAEGQDSAVRAAGHSPHENSAGSFANNSAVHSSQHGRFEQSTAHEVDAAQCLDGICHAGQGSRHREMSWLAGLSAERLVEFCEVLQTGLQEQQIHNDQQSCMDRLQGLIAGDHQLFRPVLCNSTPVCECTTKPCCAVPSCAVLRHAVLSDAVPCYVVLLRCPCFAWCWQPCLGSILQALLCWTLLV